MTGASRIRVGLVGGRLVFVDIDDWPVYEDGLGLLLSDTPAFGHVRRSWQEHRRVELARKDVCLSSVNTESAVEEIAVKLDVTREGMTLVDWPTFGLGRPCSFGIGIAPDYYDVNRHPIR